MKHSKLDKLILLFPLLLPVFYTLHGWNDYPGQISVADVAIAMGWYLLGTAIFYGLAWLALKNPRKAALFTFLSGCIYFFFGAIHDLLKSNLPHSFFVQYSFLLPAILVVVVGIFLLIKKSKQNLLRSCRYLSVLMCVLTGFELVRIVTAPVRSTNGKLPPGFVECVGCPRPDIFFIIADEYASNRELKEQMGFDNSRFESQLRFRGFQIADSSHSNYNYTPFSIASILSMNYIQGIEGRNQSVSDRNICYGWIDQNPVSSFLHSTGYDLINFSVFQFDNQLPLAHSSFFPTGRDLLQRQTLSARFDRDIRFNLVERFKWSSQIRVLAEVEKNSLETLYKKTLEESKKSSGHPRFVYSHLMMPHYPYFFDSLGKANPPEVALEGNQVRKDQYVSYLQYSNGLFLKLIDTILAYAKRPPVIIFMGDHGFRHFTGNVDSSYQFMNLNAIYLPPDIKAQVPQNLNGVNEFRFLFNSVFGQHLPLLKDSSIFLKE